MSGAAIQEAVESLSVAPGVCAGCRHCWVRVVEDHKTKVVDPENPKADEYGMRPGLVRVAECIFDPNEFRNLSEAPVAYCNRKDPGRNQ